MQNEQIKEQDLQKIGEQLENKEIIEEAGFDKCFTCQSDNIYLVFEVEKVAPSVMTLKHICKECNTGFQKKLDINKIILPVSGVITNKRKMILLSLLRLFKEAILERLNKQGSSKIDGQKQIIS